MIPVLFMKIFIAAILTITVVVAIPYNAPECKQVWTAPALPKQELFPAATKIIGKGAQEQGYTFWSAKGIPSIISYQQWLFSKPAPHFKLTLTTSAPSTVFEFQLADESHHMFIVPQGSCYVTSLKAQLWWAWVR